MSSILSEVSGVLVQDRNVYQCNYPFIGILDICVSFTWVIYSSHFFIFENKIELHNFLHSFSSANCYHALALLFHKHMALFL